MSCGQDKSSLAKISFPLTSFTISANSDTTLFGKQGTRLFIEKRTFQFIDGSQVNDSIKIELREFYKKSDIVLADLSAESNGKVLETGGMLNIAAISKGQKLEVKDGKRIVVHFPKKNDDSKKMNLFFADQRATDSMVSNWEIDTTSLVKLTLQILSWGYYWLDENDSTPVDSRPKNFVDTGYYWNPLDLYVNKFDFSKPTIEEINNYSDNYYIGVEFDINESGEIQDPIVQSKISKNAQKELIRFVNGLPELTPGKDKNGNVVRRRAILGISKGQIVPLFKSREEYLSSFSKKYKRFEKQPIRNMNDAELNFYIFSVGKLGWINCDRFLETEKTTDFVVETTPSNDTKIKMVFKDLNGVLVAKDVGGQYIFSKVPIGRQVTIVAIKNTRGQIQTYFKELSITEKSLDKLVFKETTLGELRQKLDELN
jgi:hypothetical protein